MTATDFGCSCGDASCRYDKQFGNPLRETQPAPSITPGPWSAFKGGIFSAETNATHNGMTCSEVGHCPTHCGPSVIQAITPDLIADIKEGAWDDVEPPNEADMVLMAASPDLLQALEDAIEYLQYHLPEEALVPHRAAIAKARNIQP